ncbi:hypothetical protein HPB49_005526 [Dermacentor silvarum]|uniref:Uncharacterized protein n=1 Tax=Dermacentor silvarum TaxID=543639 RepID=A0ACB8DWG5_DERSI|nr:hypothetical protein HPB49_005526 [Dermacentor silvarum]
MRPFKNSATTTVDRALQKAPNDFLFPHPCDSKRSLFFVIDDPVHILKYVRNDWPKQNDPSFWYPEFQADETGARRMLCVYFENIQDAYNFECD